MVSLEEPLHALEVPVQLRSAIVESLWGPNPLPKHLFNGETELEPNLDLYFRYYVNQCGLLALHEGGSHASVKTHQDIAYTVQLLKDQHQFVGKYWSLYTDEIDNFTNGSTVVGTTWPY